MPKTFGVTRGVRFANRVATAMLPAGLKPGLAHLLSARGRKSGLMRSTPVSPLEYEGRRYLVAGSHDAEWVNNARVASRWAALWASPRSPPSRPLKRRISPVPGPTLWPPSTPATM